MSAFAGTGPLTRIALRRDRLMTPLWALAIGTLPLFTVPTYQDLYPDPASLRAFAATVAGNTGLAALIGTPYDLTSIGGLVAWRLGMFMGLMAGVMSMLLVVRHTRAEEESGRLELLAAGAVSRLSPLTAGLLAALVADAAVGLLIAVGMVAFGSALAGSVALGLAVALAGACFAGIAAVAAQVCESGRAANALTGSLIGVAYLLRAVGDGTSAHGVTWLSPVGWIEEVRAYAGERWWVLLLFLVLAVAPVAVSYRLASARDLGAGLLPARPGPATGSARLSSAFALAWRLDRTGAIGWAVAYVVAAVAFGGLAHSVSSLVDDNSLATLQRIGGAGPAIDAYLSTMMQFAAVVAAARSVQVVLRLRAEESAGHAETLLSTDVRRSSWAWSHLAIALGAPLVLMLVFGVVMGFSAGAGLGPVLGAALVQVPAIWVVTGVAALLVGALPRWSPAAWGIAVLAVLLTIFGPLTDAPQWLLDVSPFTHPPRLPGTPMSWTPLAWLLLVAAALLAAGVARLTRRDLPT